MAQTRLDGHVVLVTGAAGAIGHAVRTGIEAAGGRVLGCDLPGKPDLYAGFDVTDPEAWDAVAARIARDHGRLDGLVTCAGLMHVAALEDTSFEDWRRVMSVNVDGVFLACRSAWPLLRQSSSPAIVNLSSVSGIVGGAKLGAYNASKGAVRLFSKSVALAGAKLDPPIRCNSVHPAFVESPMVDGIAAAMRVPETAHDRMRAMVPMGRYATPAEIAQAVVYLLSPAAAFVTGAEWVLDGGLTAE